MLRALHSARAALGLNGSRAVVVFDGVGERGLSPAEAASVGHSYARKLAGAQRVAAAHRFGIVTFGRWVHQANGLRCAMRLVPHTPLVFSIQEDTALGGPVPIDTRLLRERLTSDPTVYYVRFLGFDDCRDPATGQLHFQAIAPCTQHPDTDVLHRVGEWSDRPHLATRDAYERRVFPLVQPSAKVSPEQVFIRRARRSSGLWVYGKRGSMLHDLHKKAALGPSSYGVYAYHSAEHRNGATVARRQ